MKRNRENTARIALQRLDLILPADRRATGGRITRRQIVQMALAALSISTNFLRGLDDTFPPPHGGLVKIRVPGS